jgi:hypothetical protein
MRTYPLNARRAQGASALSWIPMVNTHLPVA